MLHIDVAQKNASGIAAAIELKVRSRELRPGERLPPIRTLATSLGVSPVTVAAAYKALRTRGVAAAGAGRRGTRIVAQPPLPEVEHRGPDDLHLLDLATGNPDPELLPSLDTAIAMLSAEPRLYGEPPQLRALTSFLHAEFDADGIPSGAVAIVGGALDGVERVLREHLRAGDVVAVEDPCYPGLLDLLRSGGFELSPFTIDAHGPEPAAFAHATRGAAAVVVTARAQNPTGAALTVDRAGALREILRGRPQLLLIENDPLGPVSGVPVATLAGGGSKHWVVLRSTSKFLGPDLRLAGMIGDELTVGRVRGRQSLGPRWVSTILQQLALSLWSDPSSGRSLARAAQTYANRRNALHRELDARRIAVSATSGFNVWIHVPDEVRVVQQLAERGWAVTAGERFRLHTPPAIRATVSRLEPAEAVGFADDLQAVLRPMATRFA